MGEPLTAKFEKRQRDAFQEMEEDGVADNQSEAIRTAVDAGLPELGYGNGATHGNGRTRLQWIVAELTRIFAYLGLGWLAATLFFPVQFRLYAVGWFLISLTFVALGRVLDRHEPRVTNYLATLNPRNSTTGGETA